MANRSSSVNSSSSIYYNENEPGRRLPDDNNSLKSEKLGKVSRTNQFLVPAVLLEIAILTSLAIFAYYLRFTDVFDVFNRYFKCNDTDLTYPYNAQDVIPKVSIYVNDTVLYCVATLVPVALVLAGEIFYKYCGPPATKVVITITSQLRIPLIVRRVFRFVGVFWMGLLATSILTDSVKLLAGRPRPYFLTLANGITPSPITSYTSTWCIVDLKRETSDTRIARMSFPSYYATLSFYSAAFCICYIYVIANIHGNYFLRPILSSAFAGMALLATFTRWMLYYNFWDDLLFGSIIGAAIGTYISFGILNAFEEHDDNLPVPQPPVRQVPEARPGIFKFLPRLTMRRRPRQYPPLPIYTNGNADNNSFIPNPAFQKDLHHMIENFGKKHLVTATSSNDY